MVQIGIDLGGTKTAFGVVDEKGKIVHRAHFPSISNDFEAYYSLLEKELKSFLKDKGIGSSKVNAIGVGCAGQVELESGKIFHAPNLNWTDAPLGERLRQSFSNAKVTIDNDVRAATLGEYLFGLKEKPGIYVNVFLGTGIGSGIIIHDRILRGSTNSAGEIGLTSINFEGPRSSSGNRGVYEYYASGTALGRYGQELYQSQLEESPRNPGGSRLCDAVASLEVIDGKLIGELAQSGNQDARDLVEKTARRIGVGMSNVINFLNPDVISYGGGLSQLKSTLVGTMLQSIQEHSIKSAQEQLKIVPVQLGDDAGIIGAAYLHWVSPDGSIQANHG